LNESPTVALGRWGIAKNLLKHFKRSSSSLMNLQSVMIFGGGDLRACK